MRPVLQRHSALLDHGVVRDQRVGNTDPPHHSARVDLRLAHCVTDHLFCAAELSPLRHRSFRSRFDLDDQIGVQPAVSGRPVVGPLHPLHIQERGVVVVIGCLFLRSACRARHTSALEPVHLAVTGKRDQMHLSALTGFKRRWVPAAMARRLAALAAVRSKIRRGLVSGEMVMAATCTDGRGIWRPSGWMALAIASGDVPRRTDVSFARACGGACSAAQGDDREALWWLIDSRTHRQASIQHHGGDVGQHRGGQGPGRPKRAGGQDHQIIS